MRFLLGVLALISVLIAYCAVAYAFMGALPASGSSGLWLAIVTAVYSLVAWIFSLRNRSLWLSPPLSALVVLIALTAAVALLVGELKMKKRSVDTSPIPGLLLSPAPSAPTSSP